VIAVLGITRKRRDTARSDGASIQSQPPLQPACKGRPNMPFMLASCSSEQVGGLLVVIGVIANG